jgi:hypothetical protein
MLAPDPSPIFGEGVERQRDGWGPPAVAAPSVAFGATSPVPGKDRPDRRWFD